ncbi:MAG: hypothetical protein K8R08_01340 [Methanosarcinales archaeon]|nr:hypothetical protein [Methanosarcinales archaeon]
MVLTRILREKLIDLNQDLPNEAYDDAIRQITATDAVQVTIRDFLWSDKTGLPVESYTEDDIKTISNEVFRHVYRVYPLVPSSCYAEAA